MLTGRNKLRWQMRRRRKLLSARQQQQATSKACNQTITLPLFLNASRIACYIPANGELDPTPVLERALNLGKKCYLPVLHPVKQQSLWFTRWQPGDTLIINRYGIAEPKYCYNKLVQPWALDMVITPLVAFDREGNRLGMGGGYYDRSFAYLKHRKHWRKPLLAGYAYEFQKTAKLRKQQWDVPLDLIITERDIHIPIR